MNQSILAERTQLPRDLWQAPDPHSARNNDDRLMLRALALAANGIHPHPNPRVGCVIVNDGNVVGEGWHRYAGESHAEIIALERAQGRTKGATMYVTLEPCTHYGKTPPCVDMIIKSGVNRVVIAMKDPHPVVNGSGIIALKNNGIEVTTGVCTQVAHKLNRGFCQRLTDGKPWVTLKTAVSLDGKTAMASGESQWITGLAARHDAHRLRASSAAILTGIGTVLKDDPQLTARLDDIERQPLRVIVDSRLSISPQARILQPPGRALLMTTSGNKRNAKHLSNDTVEIITCNSDSNRVDLHQVMRELVARETNELLVEAGPCLGGSLLMLGLVDQVVVYMAPDLLGTNARGMFDLNGVGRLLDKYQLVFQDAYMLGDDLRLSLNVLSG